MDAVSLTAARGFKAAGVSCGIKPGAALDLMVVVADQPVAAAGVFTTSTTAAPPVRVSRRHLTDGRAQVIVANSGCANAGTGEQGEAAAMETVGAVAARYGCVPHDVLVCSTGPIGPQLPVDKLIAGLPRELSSTPEAADDAARAIMTTDSVPKHATVDADGYVIGGIAKGAGMIRPDMATMLAFLTTDAAVSPSELQAALRKAVDISFNSLNIDGCQSTNDTVLLLASGASGSTPETDEFEQKLSEACLHLARQIATDAEGASRVITVRVAGAADDAVARLIGRHVADSDLVRTSFYGGDPNWGRIFGALGTGIAAVRDPAAISIRYLGVEVARNGHGADHNEISLLTMLADGDFSVDISVGDGPGFAEILTTDLTPDYVRFNGRRS